MTLAALGAGKAAVAAAGYADEVLADSPVGYWRLGESSGTTAADSSGNGRNGTYQNTPTLGVTGLIAGDANTAVTWDGTDEYISFASSAWWPNASPFTFECRVTCDSVAAGGEFLFGNESGANGYRLGRNGAKLLFTTAGIQDYETSSSPLSVGPTFHLVYVFNTSLDCEFYVNGSHVQTVAGSSEPGASPGTAALISRADTGASDKWDGTVDEIAVYSTALSSTRISDHYAAGT